MAYLFSLCSSSLCSSSWRSCFWRSPKTSLMWLLTLSAATLTAGCGGGGTSVALDRPNWSLADKPPVALGGPNGAPVTPPSGPAYEYRGGRDPVTGLARPTGSGAVATPDAAPPTANAESPKVIEIRKGDTLHGLSLTHHVSVKALMGANNLSSATIKPGQKLVVPRG